MNFDLLWNTNANCCVWLRPCCTICATCCTGFNVQINKLRVIVKLSPRNCYKPSIFSICLSLWRHLTSLRQIRLVLMVAWDLCNSERNVFNPLVSALNKCPWFGWYTTHTTCQVPTCELCVISGHNDHIFRLPPGCKWDLRSFGILRIVDWKFPTDVSGHPFGHIFKGKAEGPTLKIQAVCFTLENGTVRLSWSSVRSYHSTLRASLKVSVCPLKIRPIGCPETSVINYRFTLR